MERVTGSSRPTNRAALHEALPRSLLHLVEDAGHMVTYADTSGIADAVAALALTATTRREPGGDASAQIIHGR
jgi:pimeloyl-ACP methyl ester carboxylesterase